MKRRTKAQKFQDNFDAYKCIREGRKMKRSRAKDGSIPTHPIVECSDYSEAKVLALCRAWLKEHHITHWRHDSGTFQNSRGQWGTYGIKGAGDIIGIIPIRNIDYIGHYFEIECKAGKGGRLALNQQKHKKQVEDAGGLYWIIHGIKELEYYFKDLI